MTKNKRNLLILIFVVLLGAGGAGSYVLYKKNKVKKESSTTTEVATKTERVTQNISVSGTVAYDDEVKYYANEDDKRISKVLVEVGDFVEKGQVIVEYDMDKLEDLKNNLSKAKLTLKSLQLDLSNLTTKDDIDVLNIQSDLESANLQINDYKNQISDNENQISQLQAKLSIAENSLKQDKELYQKGYKSSSDIKTSENSVKELNDSIDKLKKSNDTLKKNIDAKNNIKTINSEKLKLARDKKQDKTVIYKVDVKVIEIEKAKLEIATIEKDIKNFQKYTVAETSGVVTEVGVTDGQTVSIGTELITTANNNKLIIESEISEYEVNKIKIGDEATVTGDGFENEYTAIVTKILPVAEKNSDGNIVVPIKLELKNPKETIRNNYSVTIKISKKQANDSVLVPVSAITKDTDGKSYVNVMNTETKKVSKKEIKTGEIVGTEVEVKGLDSNEKVVKTSGKSTNKNKSNSGGGNGGPPADGGAPQGPPPGGN